MSVPTVALGSEVATIQKLVLRVMRGRAYRWHVPVALRLQVIQKHIVARGKELAMAALGARAVAGYMSAIGDRHSSVRWHEMADDLDFLSRQRLSLTIPLPRSWDPEASDVAHAAYARAFEPWNLKALS